MKGRAVLITGADFVTTGSATETAPSLSCIGSSDIRNNTDVAALLLWTGEAVKAEAPAKTLAKMMEEESFIVSWL
jgi:hypothetical protein